MVTVLKHFETIVEDAYHHYRHILRCYRCKERGRHEVAWLCALSHSLPNEVIKSVLHCQVGDHSFPLTTATV